MTRRFAHESEFNADELAKITQSRLNTLKPANTEEQQVSPADRQAQVQAELRAQLEAKSQAQHAKQQAAQQGMNSGQLAGNTAQPAGTSGSHSGVKRTYYKSEFDVNELSRITQTKLSKLSHITELQEQAAKEHEASTQGATGCKAKLRADEDEAGSCPIAGFFQKLMGMFKRK